MPRVLGGCVEGGRFLMGEVPLHYQHGSLVCTPTEAVCPFGPLGSSSSQHRRTPELVLLKGPASFRITSSPAQDLERCQAHSSSFVRTGTGVQTHVHWKPGRFHTVAADTVNCCSNLLFFPTLHRASEQTRLWILAKVLPENLDVKNAPSPLDPTFSI